MLVSVIIPTFNRAAFVREAVASVLAQRDVDFELIVIDDGSDDNTAELLRDEFGSSVDVIGTDTRGVSAARNLGVHRSRGALVAFLDSDDLWLPEKLRVQVGFFAEHPEAQICQTEEIWMRHGRRLIPSNDQRKLGGRIFAPSLRRCMVSPSAVMLRRKLFDHCGGFDETLPACEDYDLWLRISRNTPIALIESPLVIRRAGHEDQLSRRYWGMDRFRIAALMKLLAQEVLSTEQRQLAIEVLSEKCRIVAAGAAKRGRTEEAQRYAMIAQTWEDADAAHVSGPAPRTRVENRISSA